MHEDSEGVISKRFSAPLGEGDDDDFLEFQPHCIAKLDCGVGREVGVEDMELVTVVEHLPASISDGEEVGFGLGRAIRPASVVFDGWAEYFSIGEMVLDVPVAPADDGLASRFGDAGDGGC